MYPSLQAAFRATAQRQPGTILLSYEGRTWTFGDVDAWSDRIATALIKRHGFPNPTIGLFSDDLPAVLAGYLGIWKAGGASAGLDPAAPQERLLALVAAGGVGGILTDAEHATRAASLGGSVDDALAETREGQGAPGRPDATDPDRLSHMLFTSGSSGQPKAVPRTHRAMLHNAWRQRALGYGPSDRVTLISRRGFFDSVSNPFVPLLFGSTICAMRLLAADGEDLADWIQKEAATVYYSFPTVLRQMVAGGLQARALQSLRLAYLGGERVDAEDLRRLGALLRPEAHIATGLGSTEAGIITLRRYKAKGPFPDPLTVGAAVDETGVEIWNADGCRLPAGASGQVVVRSRYVFEGYRNGSAADAQRICEDAGQPGLFVFQTGDRGYLDENGELVVAGRVDDQVKIRGFRIELGDVESALRRDPRVAGAVALAAPSDPGGPADLLVAFATGDLDDNSEADLRAGLAARLPPHMVPGRILVVDHFPLTRNGKVDRRALTEVFETRRQRAAPRGERPADSFEAEVAALWTAILGVADVRRSDRFFALGGTSIKALLFTSRLGRNLGFKVPLGLILEDDELASYCAACAGLAQQG